MVMPSRNRRPKRSLSAYNFFFAAERGRLLASLPSRPGVKSKKAHGKISFADLARTISARWKKTSSEDKAYYAKLAMKDKFRYLHEMEEWRACQQETYKSQEEEKKSPFPNEKVQLPPNSDCWEPIKLDLPSFPTHHLSPSRVPLMTSWNAFDFEDDALDILDEYRSTSFHGNASFEPSPFEHGRPPTFQTSFPPCEAANTA